MYTVWTTNVLLMESMMDHTQILCPFSSLADFMGFHV